MRPCFNKSSRAAEEERKVPWVQDENVMLRNQDLAHEIVLSFKQHMPYILHLFKKELTLTYITTI